MKERFKAEAIAMLRVAIEDFICIIAKGVFKKIFKKMKDIREQIEIKKMREARGGFPF